MNAREQEAWLLTRCADVATGARTVAQDPREANVFNMASMILCGGLNEQARNLARVSEAYFSEHPGEKVDPAEVVSQGWVISPRRLKDMLTRALEGRL